MSADEPSHPSVSTATSGTETRNKEIVDTFVKTVLEDYHKGLEDARNGIVDKTKEVEITVNNRKRGCLSTYIGPETVLYPGKRLEGLRRDFAAAYLIWRDGNRCTVKADGYCTQGAAPFANPTGADFDHIDPSIEGTSVNKAKNMRLLCHACNSHIQGQQRRAILHRKPKLAAASPLRERESGATTYSGEIAINVDLWPAYGDWLDEHLKTANGIPISEAIFTATRELRQKLGHGAHQTIRGYLQVLTNGDDAPYWIDTKTKILRRNTRAKPSSDTKEA